MLAREVIPSLRERHRRLREEAEVSRLPTGIPDLDRKLGGGLPPGTLTTVAARTSMGKTATILELIRNACEHLRETGDARLVAFFSAELPAAQVFERILAAELGVPTFALVGLEDARYDALCDRLATWPLAIYDHRGPSLDWVQETLHRAAGGWEPEYGPSPLALMVLDHLGKVSVKGAGFGYETVSTVADGLYAIAGDWQVPVVACAQVNRGVENRVGRSKDGAPQVDDTRPMLADIEGSGKIEQASDLVLFPWRGEYYRARMEGREEARSPMEIGVAKNRIGGRLGPVKVEFDPDCARLGYTGRQPIHSAEAKRDKAAVKAALREAFPESVPFGYAP